MWKLGVFFLFLGFSDDATGKLLFRMREKRVDREGFSWAYTEHAALFSVTKSFVLKQALVLQIPILKSIANFLLLSLQQPTTLHQLTPWFW